LAWEAEPGDHAGSGDYGEDMWCLGVCLGCVKGEGSVDQTGIYDEPVGRVMPWNELDIPVGYTCGG